jgi:spoIIIJ-associated protein
MEKAIIDNTKCGQVCTKKERYIMEWKEFSAKTTNEALTNALIEFNTSSDKVEYEVVEKESSKLLGLINKPAIIRVRLKMGYEEIAKDFLVKVFHAMNMEVEVEAIYHEDENTMDIELTGNEMGILIGKRGNTLDSLQYLVSLAVNRNSESYIKVKLDTENYRERRKETLENLAHNLAHKVKRIHKPVYLEPMNPYERRIIHSALQKDKYVETHSEGEEPYRKVVITLKDGVDTGYENRGRYSRNRSYGKNNYRKPYSKKNAYNRDESVEETVSTDVEA